MCETYIITAYVNLKKKPQKLAQFIQQRIKMEKNPKSEQMLDQQQTMEQIQIPEPLVTMTISSSSLGESNHHSSNQMTTTTTTTTTIPSSARHMSRQLTKEFLSAYRSATCLWKVRSPEYMNKELKQEAYQQLEEICRRERPEACREFVVKKINSLRGSFRREYRRAITQKNYLPQLWFYDLLLFTADQDNDNFADAASGYSSTDIDGCGQFGLDEYEDVKKFYPLEENPSQQSDGPFCDVTSSSPPLPPSIPTIPVTQQQQQQQPPPLIFLHPTVEIHDDENSIQSDNEFVSDDSDPIIVNSYLELNNSEINSSSRYIDYQDQQQQQQQKQQQQQQHYDKKRKLQNQRFTSKRSTIHAFHHHHNNNNNNNNGDASTLIDEFSAYGITVAAKLKQMNTDQRLFAEHQINQILFKGLMNTLKPPIELIDIDNVAPLQAPSSSPISANCRGGGEITIQKTEQN